MRVSCGGGAKPPRGGRPVGGARYPWERGEEELLEAGAAGSAATCL